MDPVRLLDLAPVPSVRSQTIYHAVAYALDDASPDTDILVASTSPYVCIGFHQEPEKEVDPEYRAAHDQPIYRREVGGGAVYLDGNFNLGTLASLNEIRRRKLDCGKSFWESGIC